MVYACPQCRHEVLPVPADIRPSAYACSGCDRRFPAGDAFAKFLLEVSEVGEAERSARDRQAREYDAGRVREKGRLYFSMHGALVARLLRDAPPGPLLDAGSGTGIITQELLRAGREIVALDFSEASLAVLADKRLPRVTPILGSVTALPALDASFPAIHCSGVMQALPAAERALAHAEFARCLQPGGMLLVVAWNEAFYRAQGEPTSGRFGSGIPYFSFTREDMAREARAAGFEDVSVRPFGIALGLQVLPGGRYLFPVLGKHLHPVEGWLHGRWPAGSRVPSEYWMLVARKPA